ncbi:hypothetical protein BOH66_15250 [Microbacterium aurum]|uniref:Uncharacterized protein n=1 Tax=Microbacterium aurum TaxID=36805 RepID=A0A1P8UBL2_9MICO|nr:hypothetical protein [Microbacterium aurum]APZ35445.1 hypothetical protein BOH66_15250 [Microbacterium aurum]MBM7826115.1 hypothetical protein [Microbacterium aurum]
MIELERLMKQLHREANPDAISRSTSDVERVRLAQSRDLASERGEALLRRLNIAATAGAAEVTQAHLDECQLHLDAARGFGELIGDIDEAAG